jgi:uncharacterized RDD family membrane protein YckC
VQAPPTPYAAQPTVAGPAPGLAYAGFWGRVLAQVIDSVILIAVLLIGTRLFVTRYIDDFGNTLDYAGRWWWVADGVISLLYFPVTWVVMGETPGHRALRMEVRRVDNGERITAGTAAVRYLGWLISSLLFGIPFLIAAFDSRKQALHDRMANTVVVRRLQ